MSLEPSHQGAGKQAAGSEGCGLEGIKHVGREYNEIPFGSKPSVACGLHADPSCGRMQDPGREDVPSQAGWAGGQLHLQPGSQKGRMLKSYCPFWL